MGLVIFLPEPASFADMARTYFIFLLVAGMLAAMLPGGGSTNSIPDSEASESRSSFSSRDSDSNSSPALPADAIALTREYNGHFYADVKINGSPIRVLVDTGASGIALSRDDARRAGVAVSAGMFEVVGEGANGDVHGEFVKLDRVSLGKKTVEDVSAVVLDQGGQSLLGQSFLSKFDTVEIRGDTMFLR
jgi:aspartyl protease family protein